MASDRSLTMVKSIFTGLFLLTVINSGLTQVILTEVMYDALGPERSDEFIEIYNTTGSEVNLNGWKLGDGASFDNIIEFDGRGVLLQPGQYGIVLDPDYFTDSSQTYSGLIPPDALILTIDGPTFGNGGLSNSASEPIVLLSALGDTVQYYRYSIGNSPGKSDEKIVLNEDNSPQNWGDSRRENGTPGSKNSLTLATIDLGLNEFFFRLKPSQQA